MATAVIQSDERDAASDRGSHQHAGAGAGQHGRGDSGGVPNADDLAVLIASFDRVTARLQDSQRQLRSEVARLNGELGRANEQLKRSERLAALGEMAAGISHEVRNPLASIRLYARMLEDDLVDRPEQRGIALKIGSAVRGLDAVVSDVLAFSAEIQVRRALHSSSALIQRAIDGCRAEIDGAAGLEIVWDTSPGSVCGTVESTGRDIAADFDLWCDGDSVVRSLINLIRNAIEAVCGGPGEEPPVLARGVGRRVVVSASAGTALFTSGKRRPIVSFRVADSGEGIPPEVVQRMFNPFFTTRPSGTGLGLAIVHRIADAHDGRIEVGAGLDGGGASVSLVLPRDVIDDALPALFDAGGRGPEERSSGTGGVEPGPGVDQSAGSGRTRGSAA